MAKREHEKRPSIGSKIRIGTSSRIGEGVVIGHLQLEKRGGKEGTGGHEPFIVQVTEWLERPEV